MIGTVTSREVFIEAPSGSGVLGGSYYTTRDGQNLISIHSLTSRSDTVDIAYIRRSRDGGKTWSETEDWPTRFDHSDGTGRRHPRGGYVDPEAGRYITVWTEGVLPTDDPLEGMKYWKLHYSVSEDVDICEDNPRGNRPRYPIVLGEVDRDTGCLLRDTVTIVDDRQAGEHERVTLSNFYVREELEGDLLLHLPRLFAHDPDDWTSDLMLIRIVIS